jgi:hypothetical protein
VLRPPELAKLVRDSWIGALAVHTAPDGAAT